MATVETIYVTKNVECNQVYVCIYDNDYSVTIDTSDDDAMGDFERELSRAYALLDAERETTASLAADLVAANARIKELGK